MLNGSTNVALRWNYTLGTGELVASKTWQMDGIQIALVGLVATINDDRFAVDSEEVATLIIKDVSKIEDATIRHTVQTTINIWKYEIRVEITGEKSCKSDTLDGSFWNEYSLWQQLPKIAVVECHIFVRSPQLRCIPASLADNPYAHSSLFNKTMVKLIYYLLDAMLCSRKGLFSCDSQEIWNHTML